MKIRTGDRFVVCMCASVCVFMWLCGYVCMCACVRVCLNEKVQQDEIRTEIQFRFVYVGMCACVYV